MAANHEVISQSPTEFTPSDSGDMVFVEGGTFLFGKPTVPSLFGKKSEQRSVSISSFMLGRFPVTQGQWEKLMGNNPCYFKGKNLPVENVSYQDVLLFIDKLKAQTGKKFRLPTEAEWEYAAGAGPQDLRYAGSNDLDRVGWYVENSGCRTHEVGLKLANAIGLHDMSGNVWEWTQDLYDEHYAANCSDTNPQGPTNGTEYVFRGGSWDREEAYCTVFNRCRNTPGYKSNNLGFRLACD